MVTIAVTDHALRRYRRRMHQPHATLEDVAALLEAGEVRLSPPHGVNANLAGREREPAGYVVVGAAVFPVMQEESGMVAVTCLKAQRRCKADRRAWREQRRELYA